LSNPDLNGVRAFNVTDSNITNVYPEFTKVSSDENFIDFLIDNNGGALDGLKIIYHKQL
jgi:hypothetical protein